MLRQAFFFIIYLDVTIAILWGLAVLLRLFKYKNAARRLFLSGAVLLVIGGLSPLAPRLLNHLENRFPTVDQVPSGVVGAILLGGSFDKDLTADRGQLAYNMAAGRVNAFAELAHAHPHLKLVVTGGGLVKAGLGSEAEMTRDLFNRMGLKPHLMLETQSKNTDENATMSAHMLKPQKGQKWLLVTSAFHMPRAVGLFRKAGFDVIAYPVDYHTGSTDAHAFYQSSFVYGFLQWHYAIREFAGMINAYLSEMSDELYPRP